MANSSHTSPDEASPDGALSEFLRGIAATLPFIIGSIPFALIYGVVAASIGLSIAETAAFSLFVFSGSAQFLALSLIAAGVPFGIIWATTLILNIRHTLYAATLSPYVRNLSYPWRFILSAFLTDETFAAMETRYRARGATPNAHWAFLGSCFGMYTNWNFWTLIAVFAGQKIPALTGSGMEFGAIAAFIGMVVPRLKEKSAAIAALASGAIAISCVALPYNLNLTLAAIGGILAGTFASKIHSKRKIG